MIRNPRTVGLMLRITAQASSSLLGQQDGGAARPADVPGGVARLDAEGVRPRHGRRRREVEEVELPVRWPERVPAALRQQPVPGEDADLVARAAAVVRDAVEEAD